jgi:hypothetical protein
MEKYLLQNPENGSDESYYIMLAADTIRPFMVVPRNSNIGVSTLSYFSVIILIIILIASTFRCTQARSKCQNARHAVQKSVQGRHRKILSVLIVRLNKVSNAKI